MAAGVRFHLLLGEGTTLFLTLHKSYLKKYKPHLVIEVFLICFAFQESKFFCSRDLLEWGWSDLHGPSRSWTSPTPRATSPTGSIKKRKFWKVWTILTSSVSYYYLSWLLNWLKQHFWNYLRVLSKCILPKLSLIQSDWDAST